MKFKPKRAVLKGVKVISFLLLFCVLFLTISGVLVNPAPNEEHRHYQWIRGYYDEPEDSLDAVFIGSSSVYSSWQAPIAYGKYKIRVYPFTSASQSFLEAKEILNNIRKKQNKAVFLISTNTIGGYSYKPMHYILDYLPLSYKFQFVREMTAAEHIPFPDSLEYMFPLIRFHERWNQLLYEDFHYEPDHLKGGSHYAGFLSGVTDVSEEVEAPFDSKPLDPSIEARILDLLDYCDRTNVDVLFVSTPWVGTRSEVERIRMVNRLIESNGFPVLNLMDHMDELGLNLKEDYYDIRHTNIHGALKITDYLAQYLLEHYDFPEKSRGGGTRVGILLTKSIKRSSPPI